MHGYTHSLKYSHSYLHLITKHPPLSMYKTNTYNRCQATRELRRLLRPNTASTASVVSAQMQQSSLPSGIPMPKPLNLDNVAANWNKFKRAWDIYALVVRLQQFDEEYAAPFNCEE